MSAQTLKGHIIDCLKILKEYILKKIRYVSKFLVKNLDILIDHSEVIIVVNKEEEFEGILNKVPEEKLIYDLVNINFENKSKMKNYIGIAW